MGEKAYLDRGCNSCMANCHEYSLDQTVQVQGKCGDTRSQDGCYGLIYVPYRNPSPQALANISHRMAENRGTL